MVVGALLVFPARLAGEEVTDLQVRGVETPWGTVTERMSYYLRDGKVVQHGLDEMFSKDGGIQIRARYAHGEPDGLYQIFYDGIGTKQTETVYVAGVEDGPSRTMGPDGKLLFEGTRMSMIGAAETPDASTAPSKRRPAWFFHS